MVPEYVVYANVPLLMCIQSAMITMSCIMRAKIVEKTDSPIYTQILLIMGVYSLIERHNSINPIRRVRRRSMTAAFYLD